MYAVLEDALDISSAIILYILQHYAVVPQEYRLIQVVCRFLVHSLENHRLNEFLIALHLVKRIDDSSAAHS